MRFSQGPHSTPVAECRMEYKFSIYCLLIFATLLPAEDVLNSYYTSFRMIAVT